MTPTAPSDRRPFHLLLATAVAVVLGSLSLACGGVDLGNANLLTVEDEWRLGGQLASDLEAELTLIDDPKALALLDTLGQQLVAQGRFAGRPWEFHLVADEAVNAFNIPGGHVYVNAGLLAAAADASQFMAVLAHETAHGTERHATQQLTRAYGLQLILELALGREPGTLKAIAANIAAGGTLAHASREAEREADRVGLNLMAAAGYEPAGMVLFFEQLLALQQREPDRVSQFFSSHPLTEVRIEQARSAIAELPRDPSWRSEDEAFARLRVRTAALAPPARRLDAPGRRR